MVGYSSRTKRTGYFIYEFEKLFFKNTTAALILIIHCHKRKKIMHFIFYYCVYVKLWIHEIIWLRFSPILLSLVCFTAHQFSLWDFLMLLKRARCVFWWRMWCLFIKQQTHIHTQTHTHGEKSWTKIILRLLNKSPNAYCLKIFPSFYRTFVFSKSCKRNFWSGR